MYMRIASLSLLARSCGGTASHLLLGLAEKIFDEKRYIGRALTQRGSIDRQYGNPVKEILSEFARTDLLVKLAIRGRNYSNVDRNLTMPANRPDRPSCKTRNSLT